MSADEFVADIVVSADSKIIIGQFSWAPNLFVDGNFYPGRILVCAKNIMPGEQGRVTLGVLYDDTGPNLVPGKRFQLRDGPSSIIAEAVVV